MRKSYICQRLDFPLDEAKPFVDELESIHLLTTTANSQDDFIQSASWQDSDKEANPQAGVLPGTDDLEAEFEFQDWAKARGFLWAASWELTYRCNEMCLHCYNPGASHDHSTRGQRETAELNPEEWTRLLQDLRTIGVFRLALTGGEVLMNRDFFAILQMARQLGFSVSLMTNGLRLTDKAIARIASLWPHRIELSLYSHIAEKHDRITGVPGSWQRTLQAVEKLKSVGMTVMLKMVLMKHTLDDIDGFKALARQYGCEALTDPTLSVGNDGSHDTYLNLRPSAFELIRAALNHANPLWCGTAEEPLKRFTFSDPDDTPCGAGHAALSINPEGHVYPCLAFPLFVGSIRQDSLVNLWRKSRYGQGEISPATDSPLSVWQSKTVASFDRCGGYERCAWCSKCAGASFLETGDETAPNTVKCRQAGARMIAHQHLLNGGARDTFDEPAFVRFKQAYPKEYALWNDDETLVANIGLAAVRQVLQQKTRQRVLQELTVAG